jgi:hypothetical protein
MPSLAPSAFIVTASCANRAVEAQQYRASGLAVVTAAIALWNTGLSDRARDDLHLGGEVIADALLAHLARSAGSTSTSPAIISGIPTAASVPTVFGRFARQQQTCARSSLPDRVPDLVRITVLSCPFYGVTP